MYALCSNKFQQIQFQLWHVVLTIFRSRPGPLLSPQLGMPAMGPPLGHPGTSDSIPLRWTCLSRTKLVTCFALFCCIDILYIIYILYYNFDNIYIYIETIDAFISHRFRLVVWGLCSPSLTTGPCSGTCFFYLLLFLLASTFEFFELCGMAGFPCPGQWQNEMLSTSH